MPTDRYTVAQAAALAGVSPSSVRNWCAQFAAHLSSGASPAPGEERLLSPADVAILQQVAQWRAQRMGYDVILQQLADLSTDELQPYIEVAPTLEPAPLQQPTGDVTTAIQLIEAIDQRYSSLQLRMEQYERGMNSRLTWFAWGLLGGLGLALFVIVMWAVLANV
jgi:DNA-binding transcriptional MerR regulator